MRVDTGDSPTGCSDAIFPTHNEAAVSEGSKVVGSTDASLASIPGCSHPSALLECSNAAGNTIPQRLEQCVYQGDVGAAADTDQPESPIPQRSKQSTTRGAVLQRERRASQRMCWAAMLTLLCVILQCSFRAARGYGCRVHTLVVVPDPHF